MRLAIKVVPKAARDEVAGWMGDLLKVRVAAPPERGKANAAVEAILARALGLPRERVRLAAGATSARKVFEIDGIDEGEARRRLEAWMRGEGS